MILAEQKVDFALAFAEDALVLERGRVAFRGRTAVLREDEALRATKWRPIGGCRYGRELPRALRPR
jgi:hypothetical protein